MSSLVNLQQFPLKGNRFTFEDIEPNVGIASYSPQQFIGETDTVDLYEQDSHTLSVACGGSENLYQWYKDGVEIPGAASNEYQLTAISSENVGVYTCDVTSLLVPDLTIQTKSVTLNVNPTSLELTSPNGEEVWMGGTNQDIIWNSTGTGGNVHIEYSTNSGNDWNDVVANTPDDGIFEWVIPNEFSYNCLVRVSDLDAYPTDRSDNIFSMVSPTASDSLALIALYDAMGGDNWTNNTNWKTGPVSSWHGISTSGNRVTGIDLLANNLVGTVPAEIGNLTELTYLGLTNNSQLSGSIPPELGNCTKLRTIFMARCDFSGEVPVEIGNCTDLMNLFLYQNDFSGLPDLSSLVNLQQFPVNGNRFTFEDIEPNVGMASYSPQQYIGETDTVGLYDEDSFTLSVTCGGSENRYQWYKDGVEIPGATSNEYQLTAISSENVGVYTCDVTNLLVPGLTIQSNPVTLNVNTTSLELTSPNGEEVWLGGTNQDITWNSTGTGGNVQIEYSTNSGNDWNDVVTNTPDDGIFEWVIPNEFSYNCLVRVSDIDAYPTDRSDNIFSMVSPSASDSLALIALYDATDGDNWTNNTNWKTGPVSSWLGISTKNNRVTGIDLMANNLVGTVPGDIGNLTELTYLGLTNNNQLSGSIPPELGHCTKLRTIFMARCGFTGDVPAELVNSTGLVNLFLYQNDLSGLPDLSSLVNLQQFPVKGNRFTFEDIEPNVGIASYSPQQYIGEQDTTDLYDEGSYTLSVTCGGSDNRYQWYKDGVEIPGATSYEYHLTDLQTEDAGVYTCDVTNALVPDLIIQSNPVMLNVNATSLELTSPNGQELWLAGSNQDITWTSAGTSGDVRIEYSINSGTDWTDVSSNTPDDGVFEWIIPNELSFNCLVRVSDLDAYPTDRSDNSFSIVSSLGNDSLALIALYDATDGDNWTNNANWKTGPVSSWYGITTSGNRVTSIDLINNNLVGTIPSEIGNLTELTYLGLTNNSQLSGSIPPELGNCTKLRTIFLARCDLSGDVPAELANCADLMNLFLYNNNLSGLPDLTSLVNLQQFPVRNNRFTFEDIEPNVSISSYVSQQKIGEIDTVELYNEDSYTLSVTCGGSDNRYQWYKDGDEILGATSLEYHLTELSTEDAGVYTCDVTSPLVPDLTIQSNPVTMNVGITSLELISPNGEEILQSGSDYVIRWTSYGDIDNIRLEYSTDNGESWNEIIASTPNDGTYLWSSIPVESSSNCLTRISDIDGYPYDTSDAVYSIISISMINITAPNGGESYELGTGHYIRWTSMGTSGDVHIEYSTNSGTNWIDVVSNTRDIGVYYWNFPFELSNNCLVRISDVDNDPVDVSDAEFIITGNLETDSLALAALYDATDGDNWTNNANWKTGPVSSWYGVSISRNRVTGIDLMGNNLVGTVPSEIGNITELTYLGLTNNSQLSGSIPPELGNCTELRTIFMAKCDFTGDVPAELVNCTGLVNLFLYQNDLSSLPDFSSLANLQQFPVKGNRLTFEDIEPNVGLASYSPQQYIGETDTVDLYEQDSYTLSVTCGGSENRYQWYKDGTEIPGATSTEYHLTSVQSEDAGIYTCDMTSPLVPDLTISSNPVTLNVSDALIGNAVPFISGTNNTYEVNSVDDEVWQGNTALMESVATKLIASSESDNSYDRAEEEVDITLYPNPTNDYINIELLLKNSSEIIISVLDQNGHLILIDKKNAEEGIFKSGFNVSKIAKGLYYVQIQTKDFSSTKKLVVY